MFDEAFQQFCRNYPTYDSTRKLDRLRVTDYARLDREGHVYLDYTGASMPNLKCANTWHCSPMGSLAIPIRKT